jgi:hypothetical protein
VPAKCDGETTQHFQGDGQRQQLAGHAGAFHVGLRAGIVRDLAQSGNDENQRDEHASGGSGEVLKSLHGFSFYRLLMLP